LVVACCEYVAVSGFPSILVGSMITMGVAFNGWGTVAACRVEVLRVALFAAILHCSPGMCRLRRDRLARFIPLYQSIVACCYRILGCRVLVAPQGLRCRELYRPSWTCWGIGVPFLFGGADRSDIRFPLCFVAILVREFPGMCLLSRELSQLKGPCRLSLLRRFSTPPRTVKRLVWASGTSVGAVPA
jgi:hypothetical protein